MSVVVVLGCHRSGTSLIASMLNSMGVDMMGKGPNLADVTQPDGHWEDVDFLRTNIDILADNGGTWDDPPEVDWREFRPDVAMLVTLKQHPELQGGEPRDQGAWWGWKDPRTCLTVACYHRYLEQPHYIALDRDTADITDSLEYRNGRRGWHWWQLTNHYLQRRNDFLNSNPGPVLRMSYEELTDPASSLRECLRLAEFLGMGIVQALAAKEQIRKKPQPIVPEPWLEIALTQARAAAGEGKSAIGILGKPSVSLARQTRQVLPNARLLTITPELSDNWRDVIGPLHGLLINGEVDKTDTLRWIGRVRPGGFVAMRGITVDHDWPQTAWQNLAAPAPWILYRRLPYLKAGDGFGTIGIGVPYMKADYNFFRWWSWMLRHGLESEDELLNDDSVMAPLPIPCVHNRLIARFLESDRDTFCIVEDDHCGDPANPLDYEVLRQMREKQENHGFDVVTANYVNRREGPGIVGYKLSHKPNRNGEYICILDYDDVWRTGTQPVDGSVFGLALIRRWVLDKMLDGGNPREAFWCEWKGANSQDVNFYGKVRDLTHAKVGVDRDANIGHGTYSVRGVSDFWEARGKTNG